MAGLFFWHKSQNIEKYRINKVFKSLGYNNGKYLEMGNWDALVFPKNGYNIDNWKIFDDGSICCKGTFAYKGKLYNLALTHLAEDIRNNKIDLTEFWGSFLIFSNVGGKNILLRDGAFLTRLYCLSNKPVYSTSFAGLIRSSKCKLFFNKNAAVELLSTGLISGFETLIKEIDFIGSKSQIRFLDYYLSEPKSIPEPNTFKNAVTQQVEIAAETISKISKDWFNYDPKSILNLGITAGLDSRLLLAFVHSITNKYNFYTFWRPSDSEDPDFRIAKQIVEYLKRPLFFQQIKHPFDMSEQELSSLFYENFMSCDGVIRPGTFWDEGFTSISYRQSLVPIPYLRMTAFEGEQYRNMERLPLKSSRSLRSWVRWDIIYRFAGHNFISRKARENLEDRIINNMKMILGECTYNLISYREYYRQIVVPSYRSLQGNIENKFGFHVSPFADTSLSISARKAYPFLGNSLEFELAMLNKLSPTLASLPNDYGFDFSKGEKNIFLLGVKLWQAFPSSIKHQLFEAYRGYHKDNYISILSHKSNFIKELLNYSKSLSLLIDVDKMSSRSVRGRLVLNLGYFLKVNEEFITW